LERADEEMLIALWADADGWVVVPWRGVVPAPLEEGKDGEEDGGWVYMSDEREDGS
jgi:hypothetical protein